MQRHRSVSQSQFRMKLRGSAQQKPYRSTRVLAQVEICLMHFAGRWIELMIVTKYNFITFPKTIFIKDWIASKNHQGLDRIKESSKAGSH
jgi:hypothetical protein